MQPWQRHMHFSSVIATDRDAHPSPELSPSSVSSWLHYIACLLENSPRRSTPSPTSIAVPTMRFTASTAFVFAFCTLSTCVWLKLCREGGADALQLTLFGGAAAITREFLSRRLGCSVDLYAIIAAAAPLDYLLQKGSPSWQLLGVGPCDPRRHERTEFGGCAPLQAHACYRYGASRQLEFRTMAACHKALATSAGYARQHVEQCHSFADLSWRGFESCLTVATDIHNRTDRCLNFPLALLNCMMQYGVEEEFLRVTEHMESVQIKKMGHATESSELAESHMSCKV